MFTISFSYSYVYSTQFNSFSNSNPKQSLDFKKLETQNLKYVQSSKGKNLSNFCCALAFWQICSLNNNMHAFLCSLRSVDSSRDIAVWQASNVKAIPKSTRYIQIRAFWWTYFSIHLQTKFKWRIYAPSLISNEDPSVKLCERSPTYCNIRAATSLFFSYGDFKPKKYCEKKDEISATKNSWLII